MAAIEKVTNLLRKFKENPEPALNIKVWKKIAKMEEFLLNGSHSPNERNWRTFFREFEANYISFRRSNEILELFHKTPDISSDDLFKKLKAANYPKPYLDFLNTRLQEAGSLQRLMDALNLERNSTLVRVGKDYHEYRMFRGALDDLLESEECSENCKRMVGLLYSNLGSESPKEKMMFEVFFEGENRPDIKEMREFLYQQELFVRTRLKRERNAEFFGMLKSLVSQPEFIDSLLGYIYKSQLLGKRRAVKLFKMIYNAQARNIYLPKINRLIYGPQEADKAMDLLQNLNAPIAKDELLVTFARLVDKRSEAKWELIANHAKNADPNFYKRMTEAKETALARGDLSRTNPRSTVGTIAALAVIGIPAVGYFYFDGLPTVVEEYLYGEEKSLEPGLPAPENSEDIEIDGEEDLTLDEASEVVTTEGRVPSSQKRHLPLFTEFLCQRFHCNSDAIKP